MRDGDGRTLKWFTSKPPADGDDGDDGSSVMIDSATIKRLQTYQGTKQTMLTRAKLTLVE